MIAGQRCPADAAGRWISMTMCAHGDAVIRDTAFRAYYTRLTARGMRPAKAMGHVAGKISSVLYSMLKTMTPYDEGKHRRSLGLAPLHEVDTHSTIEAPLDLVGPLDDHANLFDDAESDVGGR